MCDCHHDGLQKLTYSKRLAIMPSCFKPHFPPDLSMTQNSTQVATAATPINLPASWTKAAKPAAWSLIDVEALFNLPFSDLIHRAQTLHREHHDPNKVQLSTLLSIKTGGC